MNAAIIDTIEKQRKAVWKIALRARKEINSLNSELLDLETGTLKYEERQVLSNQLKLVLEEHNSELYAILIEE